VDIDPHVAAEVDARDDEVGGRLPHEARDAQRHAVGGGAVHRVAPFAETLDAQGTVEGKRVRHRRLLDPGCHHPDLGERLQAVREDLNPLRRVAVIVGQEDAPRAGHGGDYPMRRDSTWDRIGAVRSETRGRKRRRRDASREDLGRY
jgi:hypothetical protein